MISMEQITGEIAMLEEEKPTYVTMQKLAALYTVRDHLILASQPVSPTVVVSETVPDLGTGSEFSTAISGKNTKDILLKMDELMSALQIANPRLYASVIRDI